MADNGQLVALRAGKGRISGGHLAAYTRRLEVLMNSGVGVVDSLHFVSDGESPTLNLIFDDLAQEVSRGKALSSGLGLYPQVFSAFFRGLVRVGEETGSLVGVLGRLSDYLEKSSGFRQRIVSSLLYPLFLLIFGAGLSLLLAAYVLPAMQPLLTSAQVELPWLTRVVFSLSQMLRSPAFFAWSALVMVGLWLLWKQFQEAEPDSPLRMSLDHWLLDAPGLGGLNRQLAAGKILRMLSLMLGSGLAAYQALGLLHSTEENSVLAGQLDAVREAVREGDGLSEALPSRARVFPPVVAALVRVGEESGRLSEVCRQLADMLEEDAEHRASTVAQLLEPLALIMISLFVGTLAVATLLPWVRLIAQIA